MPFTPPSGYPYSDDSSPGANDGDVVFADHVNSVMEYLEDTLPGDILAAAGISLSNATPQDLGTAAAGVGTAASRADHVHDMPTAAQVGAATASDITSAINTHVAATDPHGDRAYADSLFAQINDTNYQGTIDASTNPNYPAADADHAYRVVAAGKLGGGSGVDVEIGDLAICLTNGTPAGTQAAVGANWTIVQNNLNGAVIGPASSTNDRIALFSGTTGKLIKQASVGVSDLQTTAYTVADTNDWPGTDPTTVVGALDRLAELVSSPDLTEVFDRIEALEVPGVNTQTADYTLALTDANKVVEMNSSSARIITVPTNASVAFPTGTIIELCRVGTGSVTVSPAVGVTIRSALGLFALQTQWATASLRKRGTNEWVLTGELA